MKKKRICLPGNMYEKQFWKEKKIVAGIDEAGRGPLAGPVCAAALILPPNFRNTLKISDSKVLNHDQHISVYQKLKEKAIFAFDMIDNEIIDKINILQATQSAMKNAVMKLSQYPEFLLVDGNYFLGFGIPFKTIVKGDSKSISIAAASIIAKLMRDNYMTEVADAEYPEYGFKNHKGYATKEHFKAIEEYGVCPLHRKSFLKRHYSNQLSLFE